VDRDWTVSDGIWYCLCLYEICSSWLAMHSLCLSIVGLLPSSSTSAGCVVPSLHVWCITGVANSFCHMLEWSAHGSSPESHKALTAKRISCKLHNFCPWLQYNYNYISRCIFDRHKQNEWGVASLLTTELNTCFWVGSGICVAFMFPTDLSDDCLSRLICISIWWMSVWWRPIRRCRCCQRLLEEF